MEVEGASANSGCAGELRLPNSPHICFPPLVETGRHWHEPQGRRARPNAAAQARLVNLTSHKVISDSVIWPRKSHGIDIATITPTPLALNIK